MNLSNPSNGSASSPASGTLTLTDVLARVLASTSISSLKKREVASSIRTVGRMIGRPIDRIPANPALLRQRLRDLNAAAGGISRGRFSNVKSHLSAALSIAGITTARTGGALSADWKMLFDQAPNSTRWRLSRLAHFCSSRTIGPNQVDDKVVAAMRHEADAEGLLKDVEVLWRDTIRAWNRAVNNVPNWPQRTLTRPAHKKAPWTIPFEQFPVTLQEEVAQWEARLLSRNPVSVDGPPRALRPSSVKYRVFYLRMIASALVHKGHPIEEVISLRYLVEPEHFFQAIEYLLDRYGRPTEALQNVALAGKAVAKHYVKLSEPQIAELHGLCRRLDLGIEGIRERNRDRLLALDDDDNLAALLHLPAMLREAAIRLDNRDPIKAARLIQMALVVELLLHTALRIGNLAATDLDRHVRRLRTRRGEVLHLVFTSEEVKNRRELHHELRGDQLALFDLYVSRYRERLAAPNCSHLLPGRFGGYRNAAGLSDQIKKTVKEFTGLQVNAHLFRHIANKIHQRVAPGDHVTMAHVLNDAISTITNTYAIFERPRSLQHYQHSIEKLRADLPNAPKVRRSARTSR